MGFEMDSVKLRNPSEQPCVSKSASALKDRKNMSSTDLFFIHSPAVYTIFSSSPTETLPPTLIWSPLSKLPTGFIKLSLHGLTKYTML